MHGLPGLQLRWALHQTQPLPGFCELKPEHILLVTHLVVTQVVTVDVLARLAATAGCRVADVPQFPAGWGYATEDCVVKLSAAWLIELAGFQKGFAMGRAGLSSKHVLAIVNRGGATAGEIVALRDAVIEGVWARTGVRLEQEPVLLGFAG